MQTHTDKNNSDNCIAFYKLQSNLSKAAHHALFLLACAIIIIAIASPATLKAATGKTDLTVGMKTLPLLNTKIIGVVKVAIVFDPNQPDSIHEAENIKAILDSGLDLPGDLSVESLMVPITTINKMDTSRIAIITSGLEAHYDEISAASTKGNILTMSTNLNCVEENKCVLGIVSKPRVEIYYSRVAAQSAQIQFGEAFTMLVKPVSYSQK